DTEGTEADQNGGLARGYLSSSHGRQSRPRRRRQRRGSYFYASPTLGVNFRYCRGGLYAKYSSSVRALSGSPAPPRATIRANSGSRAARSRKLVTCAWIRAATT